VVEKYKFYIRQTSLFDSTENELTQYPKIQLWY